MKNIDKIKKDIENVLSQEIKEYYINGNVPIPYQLLMSAHRAVHARSAYELLKEYEECPDNTIFKYFVRPSEKEGCGLNVDIREMIEKIWIPKSLVWEKSWWRKGFDIFNQDDFNTFDSLIYKRERQDKELYDFNLVRRILYCKDSEDKFIGRKLDLFLHDNDWRKSAKEYSIISLGYIKKNSDERRAELLESNDKVNFERYLNCLKTINMISELYLSEMK
jgi:hypothetical protein